MAVRGHGHLGPGLEHGLALLQGHDLGEVLLVVANQGCHLVQQRGALIRIRPSPLPEAAVRGGQGLVQVGLGGVGQLGQHRLVGRIYDVLGLALGSLAPLAVDP